MLSFNNHIPGVIFKVQQVGTMVQIKPFASYYAWIDWFDLAPLDSSALIDDLRTDVDAAAAVAAAAQATANTGVSNAAAAQTTANTGVTNAATAASAAAAAQSTANTGVTNAAAAQTTANTGVTNAATAQAAAVAAQSTANTGVTNAATAQAAAVAAAAAVTTLASVVTATNANVAAEKHGRATMWWDEATIVTGGKAASRIAGMDYGLGFHAGSLINNEMKMSFVANLVSGGTLFMHCVTSTGGGIATITIDGISLGTIDTYSNPQILNVIKSLAVAGGTWLSGRHTINVKAASKHTSALNYFLVITKFWFTDGND